MSEMEWNSKWDWENWVAYGPRKLQLAEWMVVDDDAGSFNLFAGGGSSGSDGGHVSSAKSSISASTDSSTKDGMQNRNLRLSTVGGFSGNLGEKMDGKGTGVSPPLEASIGSVEPLIGLKLGKRTYFENSSAGGSVKGAGMPTPATASVKKTKSLGQNPSIPRCIVEGCNVDLSTAKEYHRKHRVCETHSKCPKVIVAGLERRFCQQCSRFHSLAEFDEKKRSCRRRLSDHNARRRKPPQETIQFNSTRLMSPFYAEGKQQMSFLLNNAPFIHSRNPSNNSWNNTCNSKFTLTKGYHLKSDGDGDTDGQMHMPGIKLPHISNMLDNPNKGFLASKSSVPEALNPGSKGSLVSPNSDAAQEYRRALSLLSSNPWGSCGPESTSIHYPINENGDYLAQPTMHAIPEGVPLPSSELWLTEHHQSTQARVHSPVTNSNFQEIQLFKTPYEADFYSNILN